MNNLKVAIPIAIIFILIVAGVYYLYNSQVNNDIDFINTKPSPSGNISEATASASPLGAKSQTAPGKQPSTGPEDNLNLTTLIEITSPAQASFISSPVNVSGYANITSQVVEIVAKDANGKVLGSGKASACIGFTACKFTANITFEKPTTTTGTIEAYSKSTIDNQPQNLETLEVNFF